MDTIATILDLDEEVNLHAANRKMHEVGASSAKRESSRLKKDVQIRTPIYRPEAATFHKWFGSERCNHFQFVQFPSRFLELVDLVDFIKSVTIGIASVTNHALVPQMTEASIGRSIYEGVNPCINHGGARFDIANFIQSLPQQPDGLDGRGLPPIRTMVP